MLTIQFKSKLSSIFLIFVLNLSSTAAIERVIVIGIDGAGSFHNVNVTPNIVSFLHSGAYCNHALAPWSGQNWGSILTGVVPSKHGVLNSSTDEPYSETSEYPTIFKLIYENDPTLHMASLVSAAPINRGFIELSLPVFKYVAKDEDLVAFITEEYLPKNGNTTKFIFIQLSDLDHAGHDFGWGSLEFEAQYRVTDVYIKRILEAIEDNGLAPSTLTFVTADHGGMGRTHGENISAHRHVLWGMAGPGVVPHELAPETISNHDITATALHALEIQVPINFDSKITHAIESTDHVQLMIYIPIGLLVLFIICMAILYTLSKLDCNH